MAPFVAAGVMTIALAVVGILYQRLGVRRDALRFPPRGRWIHTNGRRLHVVVQGQGTPAVWFESAIAASSLSWSRVQPAVARFTTACSYDRAGLGWSDPPAAPLRLAVVVHDLEVAIAEVSPKVPCVLVGHSFGAFVCMAFAAAHPVAVRGLVLVDPPMDWIEMNPRQTYLLRGASHLSKLGGLLARLGVVRASVALLTGGAPAAPRQFIKVFGPATAHTIERLVGEIQKLPPEVYPFVQAAWSRPQCFEAMADYLTVFQESALAAAQLRLPNDVPLVVISAGDQPEEVKAAHERLARSSARGRHVVAAASGHWVPFDQPELIVDAIEQLVRDYGPGARD